MDERRKELALEWCKKHNLNRKKIAKYAGLDPKVAGMFFHPDKRVSAKSSEKIIQAMRDLGCPGEYMPPDRPPVIPGREWKFDVPIRMSLPKRISLVNQRIADLGRHSERTLMYLGSRLTGVTVTYRYLEMSAGADRY
jgi:hypothetical protein